VTEPPTVEDARDPRRSTLGKDYWFRHCRGFLVEGPGGRVGTVVETLYGARAEPDSLEVRVGRLGRRTLILPLDEVEEIHPAARRIRLKAAPPILERS
jgi:hypothetical protein